MITLHVVALLSCLGGNCHAEVLKNEAYSGEEDCLERAEHLMQINPGKEFICATVYREDPDAPTNRRAGTRTPDRSTFVVDRYRF